MLAHIRVTLLFLLSDLYLQPNQNRTDQWGFTLPGQRSSYTVMEKVQSQSYANITFQDLAISRAHARRVSMMMEGFLWATTAGCEQMGPLLSRCPAAVISPGMCGLMDTSGLLVPYCLYFLFLSFSPAGNNDVSSENFKIVHCVQFWGVHQWDVLYYGSIVDWNWQNIDSGPLSCLSAL